MPLLIVDCVIVLIFYAVLRSRKSEDWAMLSNDYEFYESLRGEDKNAYWQKATKLDQQLFVMIFVCFNGCVLFSHYLWVVVLLIFVLLVEFVWYFREFMKLKQYYNERRF